MNVQDLLIGPHSPDWPSDISSSSSSRSPTPTPLSPIPPRPPVRRRKPNTTRDQRIEVRTLREIGWSTAAISRQLGLSRSQVVYTAKQPVTPRKPTGRPSIITSELLVRIIEWICASGIHRRARWDQIPQRLNLDIGYYAIRRALRNAGFARRIARRKPPISERNREARLVWALEHRYWTPEQWNNVLWTDETWTTGGRHTRSWVTRRCGEEWDPTCVIQRIQRPAGWMFWGSFAGSKKGPAVFWEKEWGPITSASYREHVVPLIREWIENRRRENWAADVILMQDNAPAHSAKATLEELREAFIHVWDWPAYSPDLNPIETVWNWMKDWIQDHYEETLRAGLPLKEAVWEAWTALPEDFLQNLIDQMPVRCQAVIDANGRHTRY
jgi:DDE superfamily endonuclease/Transposase